MLFAEKRSQAASHVPLNPESLLEKLIKNGNKAGIKR
jgi:hypothetical protein